MDVQTQIKLIEFDKLIGELRSLYSMYSDFSNNADNIMARSAFSIVASDLKILLIKYDSKEGL